ncbi:MAG: helix-turn-helix transcriptional regulator [Armatimonadetes bacterium]|nr:helix-turn-helix transcriptional regulator [Armatimonadota bacterium]
MKRQGVLRVPGELPKVQGARPWSVSYGAGERPVESGAWQSNGGDYDGHPLRSCPYTLHLDVPEAPGRLKEVELIGIFAMHAEHEPVGVHGASVFLGDSHRFDTKVDLHNGRHYMDAALMDAKLTPNGDGTLLKSMGVARQGGSVFRVDSLSIGVGSATRPKKLLFHDLNTPASFVVFDVNWVYELAKGCPFHASGGGVPLSELASIVRVGDRVRLHAAISQLEKAIAATEDLDEARGEALTFIAIVTAATLEMGGSRRMHRVQLEAARKLDSLTDREAIAKEALLIVEDTASSLLPTEEGPNDPIIDRALTLVDRHFAQNLTDTTVAEQLGLSTSHFRFLFRKATGLPFHKYVIGLRLERARQMLVNEDLPVSEVADAVGFSGLPHFSRAFSQRFSVNPSSLRRARQGEE